MTPIERVREAEVNPYSIGGSRMVSAEAMRLARQTREAEGGSKQNTILCIQEARDWWHRANRMARLVQKYPYLADVLA